MAPRDQDSAAAATAPAGAHALVFVVRLWEEELGTRSGYRGTVREARTGASRGFCTWCDLVEFLVARVERDGGA